jgi:hypothetical protein
MAVFRGDAREPFDEIAAVVNKVFLANKLLHELYGGPPGARLSPDPERDREAREERERYKSDVWAGYGEDTIAPLVDRAVQKIEAIADAAARESALHRTIWSKWQAFVKEADR